MLICCCLFFFWGGGTIHFFQIICVNTPMPWVNKYLHDLHPPQMICFLMNRSIMRNTWNYIVESKRQALPNIERDTTELRKEMHELKCEIIELLFHITCTQKSRPSIPYANLDDPLMLNTKFASSLFMSSWQLRKILNIKGGRKKSKRG